MNEIKFNTRMQHQKFMMIVTYDVFNEMLVHSVDINFKQCNKVCKEIIQEWIRLAIFENNGNPENRN